MKRFAAILCSALIAVGGISAAQAEYPDKPIKLIVNFGAGGSTDAAARIMARKVGKILGTNFVVMNRTGAGGTLGVAATAHSRPDGYTIGTCNSPAIAIVPQLRDVPYNPLQDVVQIAAVMPYEYALMVRSDSPWKTWDDFVRYVKAHPGEVNYGSVGTGTTNHLVTARIGRVLGFDWTHVPFQTGVKNTAELLGGHVDIINNTFASDVSAIEAGKIRVLLVTSEERLDIVPNVPTMQEAGFDFAQISYMSICGPAGIPQARREKLSKAFKGASNDPDVRKALGKLSLHSKYIPGDEYTKLLKRLHDEWGRVMTQMGLIKGQ